MLTAIEALGLDAVALAPHAAAFRPLPHRLQTLGTRDGIAYVNDSISTTPHASLAALDCFGDRRVAILVGGHDRGLPWEEFAEAMRTQAPAAVITMGQNGPRIHALLGRRSRSNRGFQLSAADDLADAMAQARAVLGGEGVVLLSPGAPSFGPVSRLRRARSPFRRAGRLRPGHDQRDPGHRHRLSFTRARDRRGVGSRGSLRPARPSQGERRHASPDACRSPVAVRTARVGRDGRETGRMDRSARTRSAAVLVYDDANAIKRPGLVMVPNWMGVNPAAIEKARQIAGDDYVVLVADVYGKQDPADDRRRGRQGRRSLCAMTARRCVRVPRSRVAVLKAQAGQGPARRQQDRRVRLLLRRHDRAGAGARRRASWPAWSACTARCRRRRPPSDDGARTPVLVLNGADDRGVTDADIAAFEKEMDAAGADWQFVNFSGAVHCFAEPEANNPPGCVYNERAAGAPNE